MAQPEWAFNPRRLHAFAKGSTSDPMSEACGHQHDEHGVTGEALARDLSAARALCLARGERLTASRERVLELLLRSGAPAKAYDLMADFAPGQPAAKPPTVYRALEFLEKQGLVHRIQSLGAFVACRREGGHEAAFLICDCCGSAREIDPGAGRQVESEAKKDGFSVSSVILEAHGLCAGCRDAA